MLGSLEPLACFAQRALELECRVAPLAYAPLESIRTPPWALSGGPVAGLLEGLPVHGVQPGLRDGARPGPPREVHPQVQGGLRPRPGESCARPAAPGAMRPPPAECHVLRRSRARFSITPGTVAFLPGRESVQLDASKLLALALGLKTARNALQGFVDCRCSFHS